MKKSFMYAAAALAAVVSCSKEQGNVAEVLPGSESAGIPVGFSAYANRGLVTKADINSAADLQATEGFGVFGYYTDADDYDGLTLPNFMYNQQVSYSSSEGWTYEPVKYWPNEFGTDAIADEVDRISFFAYAPWTEVIPSTGKLKTAATTGILGLSRNSVTGDPYVKYAVDLDPAEDKQTDLLWGVVGSGSETWKAKDDDQTMEAGLPWLNVHRPAAYTGTDQQLKFTFNHALAKLNVQIDADVDGVDETNPVADGTHIFVRSVTFEGFAVKGALNLNNTDVDSDDKPIPLWLAFDGVNDLESGAEFTILDGRKDGKEGIAAAANEKVKGLNDALVQQYLYSDATNIVKTPGVTNAAVNLFNSDTETAPIYVIPNGEELKVTIVYDVETIDPSLATALADGATKGSSIENKISKTITKKGATDAIVLEAGKLYTIKLHLGMNSVEFTADVTAWATGDEGEAKLPDNA